MEQKTKAGKTSEAKKAMEQALRRIQLSPRDRLSDGRDAWSELERAESGTSAHSGKLLDEADAVLIARHLHEILQEYRPVLKAKGWTKSSLCQEAFGTGYQDSKELYRLTLPPDVDPKQRDVRRNAFKYRTLIKAIAKATNESVGPLADRILWGTKLHPQSAWGKGFEEIEQVQVTLQAIVDKVDKDCGLFQLYQETAKAKAEGFKKGRRECWPMYGVNVPISEDPEELDQYREELKRARAADLGQAFWLENELLGRHRQDEWQLFGFDTEVLQNDDFFYVPHAPLGYLAIWDLPDRSVDESRYDIAVAREVKQMQAEKEGKPVQVMPTDAFDDITQRPSGQTEPTNSDLQYYFWLLIYPHPNGKRLVPTLYSPGEEGGAYLLPLDMEALAMLRHAKWVSPTESMSVVDRLRRVLSETGTDDMCDVERAFRRTAWWLSHNPHLKWLAEERGVALKLEKAFKRTSLTNK